MENGGDAHIVEPEFIEVLACEDIQRTDGSNVLNKVSALSVSYRNVFHPWVAASNDSMMATELEIQGDINVPVRANGSRLIDTPASS